MYDLENRKQLEIIQRPLIVMDDSIISEEYMGLKEKDSILSYVLSLKDTVDYFGREFYTVVAQYLLNFISISKNI